MVFGVGITDIKCVDETGKLKESYQRWKNMLNRCYSEKCQEKRPTYIGCSVCSDWLTYSVFDEWYNQNMPEDQTVKWYLDKDLLFLGNKVYGPTECVFVPGYINTLFIDCAGGKKSNLPVGVSYNKASNSYKSQVSNGEGKTKTKYFTTPEEARLDYVIRKTEVVLKVTTKAFIDKHINLELFEALNNRPV